MMQKINTYRVKDLLRAVVVVCVCVCVCVRGAESREIDASLLQSL